VLSGAATGEVGLRDGREPRFAGFFFHESPHVVNLTQTRWSFELIVTPGRGGVKRWRVSAHH
jgi:hypothetical protein